MAAPSAAEGRVRLALTLWQPYASLCVTPDPEDPSRPVKPVENRTWPVPSTLPQWTVCRPCGTRTPAASVLSGRYYCCGEPTFALYDGPFPFRLWIHAGLNAEGLPPGNREGGAFVADGRAYVGRSGSGPFWYPTSRSDFETRPLPLGALLGPVSLVGCHHADECGCLCSPWAEPDRYHWEFADPQPLAEPIPMRGHQRLWTLPDDVAVAA